jgi:hypothetical protein
MVERWRAGDWFLVEQRKGIVDCWQKFVIFIHMVKMAFHHEESLDNNVGLQILFFVLPQPFAPSGILASFSSSSSSPFPPLDLWTR